MVLFQPHRYTRTKALYDRFIISFNQADHLIMAPIYSAGEPPIEGVNAQWLYRGIKEHGHKEVTLCRNRDEILQTLLALLKRGDLLITLGAGDIYRLGEELLKELGTEGREVSA